MDSYAVRNRSDLVAFISALRADLAAHPDEWQNLTLDGYLEAIQAWLDSAEGLRRNTGVDVDTLASFTFAATILSVGKIYE